MVLVYHIYSLDQDRQLFDFHYDILSLIFMGYHVFAN